MRRRDLFIAFGALVTAPSVPDAKAALPGSNPPITVYTVSDLAAFSRLSLPLPAKAFLFRNGLLMLPGVDYLITGSTFKMLPASLSAGDRIAVADLT